MWLDPFFDADWLQDVAATAITFAVALLWLRAVDSLAHRGRIEPRLSRKVIHIGTGPLFVLCWNLYSDGPGARWLAALVPLAITTQFVLVALGVVHDEAAVQAMTRRGDRREILRGPLFYGIVFVVCTVLFWRNSPVGVLALMLMCGGDGLADIVGRRWGVRKLPFGGEKSWAGSAAMALGGFAFGFGFVWLFNALGYFQPPLAVGRAAVAVGVIALVAAVVEALPLPGVDNLTLTLTGVVLGLLLF